MNETKTVIRGVEIKYRFKPRKYDTAHLIIVFSGFGAGGEFTYDFANVLGDCSANVLWIKDDFNGHCSYYLFNVHDNWLYFAINEFIECQLSALGLRRDQCTLAGFSNGGSAALYYGLRFEYANIIATVPQTFIGSYVKNNWPEVASHMMGVVSREKIGNLDDQISGLIHNPSNLRKNIYLLTSESDGQYPVEIEPHLPAFEKFSNFNLLLSRSILVRAHNQVTSHHVPLLLGIMNLLADGAVPKFGRTELLGDQGSSIVSSAKNGEVIALLRKIKIYESKIFPEGVSIIRGCNCANYSDISVGLILVRDDGVEFCYPLAKAHRPSLTREFYDGRFVNYDKGWFASYRFAGINLNDLEAGKYFMSISIAVSGLMKTRPIEYFGDLNIGQGDGVLHVYKDQGRVCLNKRG